MELPPEAKRRIAEDHVVRLTTVTDRGVPAVTHGQPRSRAPGYLDKYEADIVGPLQTTVEEIDRTYNTTLRIRPTKVRLTS